MVELTIEIGDRNAFKESHDEDDSAASVEVKEQEDVDPALNK